jgi:O-antigen/teichoic acid export membrane protein
MAHGAAHGSTLRRMPDPADRSAEPAEPAEGSGRGPRGALGQPTTWVVLGAGTGGAAAYLFQIVGTRALGAVDYAAIGVLWTLQYLLVSIGMTAVEAYVTRTVADLGPHAARTYEVQRVLVAWLVAAATVAGVVGYLLRDRLFAGLGDLGLVLGLLVLAYGSYTIARGRAAGVGRFRAYGLATGAESVLRLFAALLVLSLVTSTRALAWVFPLGPAVVTAWALLRPGRRWAKAHGDPAAHPLPGTAPDGSFTGASTSPTRFLASTVTANAAVQLLLAGGPLALVALAADPVEISIFFTTVTIARAPMTLVLNGGLSRALPPLLRMARADGGSGLRRPAVLTAAVTGVTATLVGAVAWVLGPPIIALLFGEAFRPGALLAATAAAGAVLAVGGLGLNQILIALGRESELPGHWLAGVAVAMGLVSLLPLGASDRVIVAFTAGTAVALASLTWRAARRPRVPGAHRTRER